MLAGYPVVEEPPAPERLSNAIKTWRYLRLAMVALVIGLGVSIVIEWWNVGRDCVLESISAYYYTPVHNLFVAVLVSVGVCLFCLKGSRDDEDTLLNLAGMFAPIVALVPTTSKDNCVSVIVSVKNVRAIENNITALLVVGGLGLVILAVLARWRRPTKPELFGYVIAFLAWLATLLVFLLAKDFFVDHAHYAAAVAMFLCIIAVVCINAVAYRPTAARSPRNPYTAVALAMVGSVALALLAKWLGWDYWVIAIEGALIGLFAVFWLIQTWELWDEGLRPGGRRGKTAPLRGTPPAPRPG